MEGCRILNDYTKAVADEERSLFQKAKVDWLKMKVIEILPSFTRSSKKGSTMRE